MGDLFDEGHCACYRSIDSLADDEMTSGLIESEDGMRKELCLLMTVLEVNDAPIPRPDHCLP